MNHSHYIHSHYVSFPLYTFPLCIIMTNSHYIHSHYVSFPLYPFALLTIIIPLLNWSKHSIMVINITRLWNILIMKLVSIKSMRYCHSHSGGWCHKESLRCKVCVTSGWGEESQKTWRRPSFQQPSWISQINNDDEEKETETSTEFIETIACFV